MFVLVIIIFIIIGFVEMVPLYKNNQKRELVVYSVLFSIAFILSMLMAFGVEIPSVAKGIENIVNFILGKNS